MWHSLVTSFFAIICLVHTVNGQNSKLRVLEKPRLLPLNPTPLACNDQFTASTPVNQWFTPKLDHLNSSNKQTWRQVNTELHSSRFKLHDEA